MKALLWLQRNVGNPVVSAILRSPVHWLLSRRTMLLTVTGRHSGRRYTIPVGFVRQDETLDILVTSRQRKAWWHNLEGGATVECFFEGRKFVGAAEALTMEREPRAFTLALRNYVAANRNAARAVGIRDVEDLVGLRAAAADTVMVVIRPIVAPSRI